MTLLRMDNVLIVVEDLEAARAFFVELGMELEGETTGRGAAVDQTVGLDDVRADIAMMRTPDGHGRVELSRYHSPPAVRAEPENAPANALGIRRIMFAVDDIDDVVDPAAQPTVANSSARSRSTRTSTGSASCVALRASSSDWPSSSAERHSGTGTRGQLSTLGVRLSSGPFSFPSAQRQLLSSRGIEIGTFIGDQQRRSRMASGSKRKTTMAKLNRERRLVERRQEKQAKKAARKQQQQRFRAHD